MLKYSRTIGLTLIVGIFFIGITATSEASGLKSWLLERSCKRSGWSELTFRVDGIERRVLWKAPAGVWSRGAILILHGGGGQTNQFCAGGKLVQPQVNFAEMAVAHGFAVFALEATENHVTDAEGRACGKRFDFSILARQNLDLPYIKTILRMGVPKLRPVGSSFSLFLTGLSTGGYMATRAAAELGDELTAFAPISAGDPFGTNAICDASLSARTSAKGILVDSQTGLEIVKDHACASSIYTEAPWPGGHRPPVKQFQDEADGIVDYSCFLKATEMLKRNGFPVEVPFVIPRNGKKDPFKHL